VARLLTNQLLTRAQQVAHLLRLCVRHEACPDQTVRPQFGQPRRLGYLKWAAVYQPKFFLSLLGRILPASACLGQPLARWQKTLAAQ
jgi:hypothetical protein